ncbi:MAG: hypothetical protein RSC44_02195, partial [Clostridia bacterium]
NNEQNLDITELQQNDSLTSSDKAAANVFGNTAMFEDNSKAADSAVFADKNVAENAVDGNVDTASEAVADAIDGGKPAKSAKADTAKKILSKAKGMKALAVLLYIISYGMIFAMTFVLAAKSIALVPYYSFWPFLGSILVGVFGLVFMSVALTVTRKKSKRTTRYQNTAIMVTFFCLTTVFALMLDIVFPDLINKATQSTLHTDDLYNLADSQLEENVALDRQFIRYNILNGNMDPKFSYHDMKDCERDATDGKILRYKDKEIQNSYSRYKKMLIGDVTKIIDNLDGHKKELFDFIYNSYILPDLDYALDGKASHDRRSVALAMCDKTIAYYDQLCVEGFKNERLLYLRNNNFTSFDKDGYLTFDDPLLLYAQMAGRMTIPAVVRLILDDTYTYTQPIYDFDATPTIDPDTGIKTYPIKGYDGFLFEIYDMDYVKANTDANTKWVNNECVSKDGFIMTKDGYVKKPMKWCVLDMDGKVMSVVSGMNFDSLGSIGGILGTVLGLPIIKDVLKELLEGKGGVGDIVKVAANGAALGLSIYLDDNGGLSFSVVPGNVKTGMLGYAQMSWMNSNNLLVGVINLINVRNYLYIFGAIGMLLVLAGGFSREFSKKLREEAKAKEALEEA